MKNLLDIILVKEIIAPVLIILFSFVFYLIIAKLIKKVFKFKSKRINVKKQKTFSTFFVNIARYLVIIIALLMILAVYGIDTRTIVASLGVASLVLGLALQDMIKDFVSGFALVLDDAYNVGDWVTINSFKGEVISIGMKTTRVKSFKGDTLIVNNGAITQTINHSMANSIAVVDVNISYESDLSKVEKILTKLCVDLEKKLENLSGEIQLLGVEKLDDSSVVFRIMAEVEPQMQYQVQREINKYVKLELDKNKISIPYKHMVVHSEL